MEEAGVAEQARAAVMDMLRAPAARLVNDGAPKNVLKEAIGSAAKGDVNAVAALVAEHPGLIDQRWSDGVTMLWTAAGTDRARPLASRPGRGRRDSRLGRSRDAGDDLAILHRGATRRAEVAHYLLDHGAHVDVFCAAFLADLDALRAHIKAGVVNMQSPHEDFQPVTPLHYAVDGGSVAAVTLLLENGADAHSAGGRLLTSAARQGTIELVRLLLDHGADATDAGSLGPVGNDRIIGELLIAKGFDLNVPHRDQETPLTMACRADKGEHPETVAALLDLGADPNAPNAKGRTPLAIATSAGFDQTVALLEAGGAR